LQPKAEPLLRPSESVGTAENGSGQLEATQKAIFAIDKLQADLQAICGDMIETRCALEETEEKNAELTLRNAELEHQIATLKAEILLKSQRARELQKPSDQGNQH
jgi:regulator of replication initiation timing